MYVTLTRSNVSSNLIVGVSLFSTAAAFLTIGDCAINGNGDGVLVRGTSAAIVANIARNTITRNKTHDIEIGNAAVIRTSNNDTLTGDPGDISGSLTPNPMK